MFLFQPKMVNMYKAKESIKFYVKFDVPQSEHVKWVERFENKQFESNSGSERFNEKRDFAQKIFENLMVFLGLILVEGENLKERTAFIMETLVPAMLNGSTVSFGAFHQQPDANGRVTYTLVLPVKKTSPRATESVHFEPREVPPIAAPPTTPVKEENDDETMGGIFPRAEEIPRLMEMCRAMIKAQETQRVVKL